MGRRRPPRRRPRRSSPQPPSQKGPARAPSAFPSAGRHLGETTAGRWTRTLDVLAAALLSQIANRIISLPPKTSSPRWVWKQDRSRSEQRVAKEIYRLELPRPYARWHYAQPQRSKISFDREKRRTNSGHQEEGCEESHQEEGNEEEEVVVVLFVRFETGTQSGPCLASDIRQWRDDGGAARSSRRWGVPGSERRRLR